jgi:heat shock protein HslJ
MRRLASLAVFVMAGAAAAAQTPYDDPDAVWRLQTLNGQPFAATATLTFPEPERIAGQAPCNRYGGPLRAEWPGFAAREIFASRMACPDLVAEGAFFAALAAMDAAALAADGALLLTNATGGAMRFQRAE